MGEPLDLDRDLPTTRDDVTALRRLRTQPRMTFDEYLQALAALDRPEPHLLRDRPGPRGAPFDLLSGIE